MDSDRPADADLEHIRRRASELADVRPGQDAGLADAVAELAGLISDLAGTMSDVAGRVDTLWRLIIAVTESAGMAGHGEAGQRDSAGAGSVPPAEFLRALAAPRSSGHQGVRLNISGKEWVAAIQQDQPPPDPASAWKALERAAEAADDQDG